MDTAPAKDAKAARSLENGRGLHVFRLQNVARCIGRVLTNDELRAKLEVGRRLND